LKTPATPDVVGVEVADHQQVHGADPQPAKAAVDGGRLRPGIHHHRFAWCDRQHGRVALADRAGDENPVGWRPTAGDQP
jgi:hypothetical protein